MPVSLAPKPAYNLRCCPKKVPTRAVNGHSEADGIGSREGSKRQCGGVVRAPVKEEAKREKEDVEEEAFVVFILRRCNEIRLQFSPLERLFLVRLHFGSVTPTHTHSFLRGMIQTSHLYLGQGRLAPVAFLRHAYQFAFFWALCFVLASVLRQRVSKATPLLQGEACCCLPNSFSCTLAAVPTPTPQEPGQRDFREAVDNMGSSIPRPETVTPSGH